jgi:hypothetical protein
MHFNIFPSTLTSFNYSLSFRYSYKNPVSALLVPTHATCPTSLILHFIARMILKRCRIFRTIRMHLPQLYKNNYDGKSENKVPYFIATK